MLIHTPLSEKEKRRGDGTEWTFGAGKLFFTGTAAEAAAGHVLTFAEERGRKRERQRRNGGIRFRRVNKQKQVARPLTHFGHGHGGGKRKREPPSAAFKLACSMLMVDKDGKNCYWNH